ncbi:hypothetical protein GN244_ATG13233 [Phytophthora infestans]|uniref:Uncharacterized protein n=1 Tax=Phytophthora infestans TaxID=4787 RepID=A0A833SY67_PHYIN|nr:hypothetical protein GN244_ATG13233 [Phytophthora infestans]KAF4128382.1 hypothetical protein GN958_ATG22460 [Phytophthora infestans]
MATATPPAAPYDDGSSTESEYYFDPREEAEEEAAYAWTHEHDPPTTQESASYGNYKSTVIKQEYRECGQLQQNAEKLMLPQGSEWSHGAASSTVYDNAVQQALAMAQNVTKGPREEPLTDDTMNSNASPTENKKEEKQEKTMAILKKKEVKVKPKLISLKCVKTPTPPASVTKAVAVGLRRSPSNVEGASSDLQKELSVARPKWKSTASQSSSQKPSPRHHNVTHSKSSHEKKTQSIQKEGANKSPSVRKSELEKVSLSRRTEHSKTPTSRRRSNSRSSSIRRRKQSRSPSVRRRDFSRSPSRRTASGNPKQGASSLRRFSRRSPSRSPSSRRFNERRRRSRSRSPRYSGRMIRSYKRSRSPSVSRAYYSTRRSRSRSRSWDRNGHHDYRTHNNGNSSGDKRDSDPRRSSQREFAGINRRATNQRQRDNPATQKEINRRGERSSVQVNTNCHATKPRLQEMEPVRSSRPVYSNETSFSAMSKAVETSKRSRRDPRIRPRVESVAATPANGKAPAYDHFDHFDPFERRVFKLKLQEADADEKLSGKFQSEAQRALYERRFYKMGLERTRLENEDFERFEQLYATTKVSGVALKRYQDNRDFAWRVMCFKQRQAALQQQKDLFVSEEVTREKWRQLDEDREKLMTENAHMFHTVMMENDGEFQRRDNAGKRGIGHGNQREEPKFKRRASNVNQSDATTSSRVIVGAALQLQGDRTRSKTFDPLRARPKNSPWFLKG